MPRRTLITASLVVLVLALIALLPWFPPVRGLIVDRVSNALSDAGIDVTFESSSGNAWRGVTFEDVTIEGAGSDLEVEHLRVGYFLPSLLGGELPLDVTVAGTTGNVDLQAILDLLVTEPGPTPGRSVSVRLRRLDLRDIEVDVAQLPFTLPDANLRQLDVTQDGSNLLLSGVIITPDGEAEVSGRYESLIGGITIQVERADATIARHWWDGVTAGQVTGEVRVRGSSIEGDFVIRDAGVDEAGLLATGVAGTATLRYPVVSADLRGTAFGGPVEATGVVNVQARRWQANGTAEPALAQAVDWLARSQLPSGMPLAVTGTGAVQLSLAGWQDITVDGSATGSGAIEDVPLEGLSVTFRLPADGGLRADGSATLGGGPVTFSLAPRRGGDRLTLTAEGVDLEAVRAGLGQLRATVDIGLGSDANGTVTARWQGALAGRDLEAVVDATLDPDGWQGFVRASDDAGLAAEGAVVLADGRLEGRLTSDQLGTDLLTPGGRVAVAVNGAVEGGLDGLEVTVSIDGERPVHALAMPEALDPSFDLRGSASGVLEFAGPGGAALRGLSGAFGPVAVSGDVVFAPLRAELNLSTAPLPLRLAASGAGESGDGDASQGGVDPPGVATTVGATLSVPASTLIVDIAGVAWNGTVAYDDAAAGPARLGSGRVDATFTLPMGGASGTPWSLVANSRSGDLVVTADPDGFDVALDGLPLRIADDLLAAAVSGMVSGSLGAAATVEVAGAGAGATAAPIAVDLRIVDSAGEGAAAAASDSAAAGAEDSGTQTARLRLPGSLELMGQVDVANSSATFSGAFTGSQANSRAQETPLTDPITVPITAEVEWGGGVTAELSLVGAEPPGSQPLRAVYSANSGRLALTGAADLAAFTTAADGRLAADFAGVVTAEGLSATSGRLTLTAQRPTPLVATVTGAGDEVEVTLNAGPDDLPVAATGTVNVSSFAALGERTDALLTASVGPFGGIAVGLAGATGAGSLDPVTLGPATVPVIPWSLEANWGGEQPPSAGLTLAGAPLALTLVDGGVAVTGSLALPIVYGGEDYRFDATVPGGRLELDDLAATPLTGALTHLGDGGANEVLTIDGTLAALAIEAELPVAQLASMLPTTSRPTGVLTVSGTLAPLDGPTYRAELELTAGLPADARQALPGGPLVETRPVSLRGTLAGTGGDVRANLSGDGLAFSYAAGVLDLEASAARLEPLIGVPGSIDGGLALDGASNWSGSLTLTASVDAGGDEPVTATVALDGRGESLLVNAGVTGPEQSVLRAAGTLAPNLAVTGTIEAAGGVLTGTLDYGSAAGLEVQLASPELLLEDYLSVPPLSATLSLAPGGPLLVSGAGIDLRADLATGTLAGDLALPFTLLGSPAELTAQFSGTTGEPRVTAEVRGEGLEVSASGDLTAAQADLILDPNVAATLVPAAAPVSGAIADPVRALARWRSGEGWALRATATAGVVDEGPSDDDGAANQAPAPPATFDLDLSLRGEADSYSGDLAVFLAGASPEAGPDRAGALAVTAISGTGGDLAAELDLATVDLNAILAALGVTADLSASGTASLATQPLRAGLSVDLSGDVEGVAVSLSGTAPDDLDLTLRSEEVDLSARIAWNEQRKAVIHGSVGGRPVEGWLELADDFSEGRLSLEAPGVDAAATLTTEPGAARHVALAAALSGEAFGGLHGDLAADVVISGGLTELRGLSVSLDPLPGFTAGGPLRLSASGRLSPEVEVTGTIVAPELDETADFRVARVTSASRPAPSLIASLAWQDLDLSYVVADRHATLSGDARLGPALAPHLPERLSGLEVDIEGADLLWSPSQGFAGGFAATVDAPVFDEYGTPGPLRLTGEATPQRGPGDALTPLRLALEASAAPAVFPGEATARLTLEVPGDLAAGADLPLNGELALTASLPAQDQRLLVEARIAGTLAAPAVTGTVNASGPIAAEGALAYDAGSGTLTLVGPHLNVQAAGDAERWSADAALDGLPLDEWLPQLVEPSLSLHASAASGGGVTVDGLVLESRASSLTGAATIRDGVRVSLQTQLDLADLELGGTRLSGLMRGPMVLTAPSLADLDDANVTAQLDAAGVSLAAVDASVSGVLQVGGKVSDPSFFALLTGNGDLSGTLRLNAAPRRGRFDLRSTLATSAFNSDVRVSIAPDMVSASGRARYRDAVALLSDGPGGVQLLGAGRIDGWEALVSNDLASLSASGPLAAVAPAVSGALAVRLGAPLSGPGDEPAGVAAAEGQPVGSWLEAHVTEFAVAGQRLSDLTVTSASPGAAVLVSGEGLRASVAPADLSWELAVEGLALPASLELSLSGAGQGASGRLEGALVSGAGAADAGQKADEPGQAADILGLDLDFSAGFGATAAQGSPGTANGAADAAADAANDTANDAANQATISLAGSALGGELRLNGTRAGSGVWSGDVTLAGAAVGGVELAANGVLQGQGLVPQAVVATAAFGGGEAPLSVAGRVSLGGNGVSFDQTAALPMFSAPLRLQGQLAPRFDVTLSATRRPADADAEQGGQATPRGSARLFTSGGGLRATGEAVLPLGPVTVVIDGSGPDASPLVEVRLAAAPSVAARAPLVAGDLGELIALLNDGELTFTGTDAAHGALRVALEPALSAHLEGFGVDLAGFSVALSGDLTPSSAALNGSLRLPLDLPGGDQGGGDEAGGEPAAGRELPLTVAAADGRWSLTSSGELGELAASYDPSSSALLVDIDLALPTADRPAKGGLDQGLSSGAIVGRIGYDPVNGPTGTLALADVSLRPSGIGELTLNADAAIADGRLGGSATLDTAGGRVTLSGNAGLDELFPGLASATPVDAGRGSNVELRVRTLALQEFPVIAAVAPHLTGALSGVVQLRNGFLLGQLVAPELAVGERPVPASLQLSGPPEDLDAALQLAGSLFTADLGGGRIAGSSRLERFPLDLLGEAFVGPTDVTAFLTGVVRFDLPSTDPASGYVRLATEEVVLERAGVTTRGEVALTYEDRSLTVQNAEFGGQGAWRAAGVLGPDRLDFTLEANDADFSPLLGLVPAVSRFGVGAAGSFTFSAHGDFAAPEVSLVSDGLDISMAGIRFRIEDTDIGLSGGDLSANTTVRGLDPLEGAIEFSGGATVMLEPLALRGVDFGFSGDLDVPGLGVVGDIRGTIQQNPQNLPVLFMTGDLGAPLAVQGTLVPLDLRASGESLKLSLPWLLVENATVAADLTLVGEEGGVAVGGEIVAAEVVIDPAAREAAAVGGPAVTPPASAAAAPAEPSTLPPAAEPLTDLPPIESASARLEPVADDAPEPEVSVAEAGARGARNAMAAIRFDDLHITAPQRVLLSMSIASLEASVDLSLAGTAADPALSGAARALRGSLRFSGREFTVDRAVASFTPNRGVLPELDVAAHADFEKACVLAGSPDVEFVAPSEGSTFTVDLAFVGPVELEDDADGGIRFDIRPLLTSDALVEVSGEGVGAGVRPLTEPELLSLITLGRIEFGSDFIGAGGLGGAVAQGALDTAVDLLVVGELQNALREALGLDVVEIRTTAISSLLGGEGAQPFGVSVRLGGYLNPELFASYRIGTADPNDPGFGFSNEVALRYALGPLNLDILGRIDFPAAGTLNNPRPELGVGVSYDFGRALSVDTGVTLSTQRSVVSFGVALRW